MENFNIELFDNVFDCPEEIFQRLETEIQYLPAEQTQVRIRGKTLPIPRQQVAFGEPNLTYTFSGLTVALNRYKDGQDCIGQHKDNEVDLDPTASICSVSYGETRAVYFQETTCSGQACGIERKLGPADETTHQHGMDPRNSPAKRSQRGEDQFNLSQADHQEKEARPGTCTAS
ncbi:alpha-ketoglutarate-dependent dioxygenase alkb-like protein [Lasius niger]|uniref:Alpha-ketoglutarate-dependent dioxygenase alkb-like protein n=1 Tax=Lasius niger TaxID=67767 RepID=A0A0J7JWU2_LASNI|nr:alpha-ketoglutarate-dependent dioxygenase alkb-like protein [Lasius niger]